MISEPAKMTGRPSIFSVELADTICDRLANGESLVAICDDDGMPGRTTVFRWLAADETFRNNYARARETQADAIFDEILTIADDARNDWMERFNREDQSVGWIENGEALRRSQLRIDARKWVAGKLRPKVYGERVTQELSGPGGGPIEVTATDARSRITDRLAALAPPEPVADAPKSDD